MLITLEQIYIHTTDHIEVNTISNKMDISYKQCKTKKPDMKVHAVCDSIYTELKIE